MARALEMLEEFTGVMYLALVVSRLIGLAVVARRSHQNDKDNREDRATRG